MKIPISINTQSPLSFNFDIDSFIYHALDLKHISKGSIDITFVNDDFIKNLHKTYLNTKSKTDIITFNLHSLIDPHGDIYICIDEAKRQASYFEHSLDHELKYLILHGLLHLIGYSDGDDLDKTLMLDEQSRLLTIIESKMLA